MATDTRIGTELAGYRIESLLGRGGMSVVYLAEDTRLKRKTALKLLASDLAADEGFRQRFVSESELAASLDHPNVIPIFEAGEADGVLFIAMRYVKTTDLKALIRAKGRSLEPRRILSIMAQTASALDAASEQGLVHRDVKPGNILVAEGQGTGGTDHVYLSDFGLTKRQETPTGLTRTGQFVGTVDYVAPEQIEGKPIDGRTDQYALACVLYECLTGHAPYPKDAETAVLIAHLMEAPPRITAERPELPSGIDNVLAKAMAKVKEDRYPNCTSFVRAAAEALGALPPGASGPVTLPGSTFQSAPPAPDQRAPTPYAPAPYFQPAPYQAPQGPGPTFTPSESPPFAPAKPKRRNALLIGGVVAALAIAVVIGVVVAGGKGSKGPQGGSSPTGAASGGFTITKDAAGRVVSASDTFSNPSSGWGSLDTGAKKQGYLGGEYQILFSQPTFTTVHWDSVGRMGDVVVQADVRFVGGPQTGNGFGLACRNEQGSTAYYFVISSDGNFAIEKSSGGQQASQLLSNNSPDVHVGQATNHVKGICRGGAGGSPVKLVMFVNGHKQGSFTDSSATLSTGAVGFTALGQPGVDLRFDNFKVTVPSK